MWLVTSPYYVKYQKKGESVYFRHMDFNLQDLADYGRGANQWQGTLSLDDEDEYNRTIMCTGMNSMAKMQQWARNIIARGGKLNTSFVTAVTDSDLTKGDLKELGASWQPQPVGAGGIRISSPLLPHGTNKGTSTKKRRTIFNWYVGMQEDHQHAEVSAGPTFDELSASHRDMTVPPRTPSGLPFLFGYPKAGFPAMVTLSGIGPIEDCLVARRKFLEYEVVHEMHKLIGIPKDDDVREDTIERRATAIKNYIESSRKRIVNKIIGLNGEKSLWNHMVALEMQAYGDNSFFKHHPHLQNARNITKDNHTDIRTNAAPAAPTKTTIDCVEHTIDDSISRRQAELDGRVARDTPERIPQQVQFQNNPPVRPVTDRPAGNTRSQKPKSSGR